MGQPSVESRVAAVQPRQHPVRSALEHVQALRPARVTVQAGTALGRIVAAGRPLWNTTARSGRFRPLRQPDGSLVPTMYLAERPDVFLETFVVESWDEHLRQHARASQADADVLGRLRALHRGPEPPRVRHLLAVR